MKNFILSLFLCVTTILLAQPAVPTGTWNNSSETTTPQAVGVGTNSPRAKQEIKMCSENHVGLIVNDGACAVQVGNGQGGDVIDPNNPPPAVENSIARNLVFSVPNYSYDNNAIPNSSYFFDLKPLIWARNEYSVSLPPQNVFRTKFVVYPNGKTGINNIAPRAYLDVLNPVRSQYNVPVAIFGSIATPAFSTTSNNFGIDEHRTRHVVIVPLCNENAYSRITENNDMGMFFTDGLNSDGTNESGSLVIAPWSASSSAGGLRINQNGSIEAHGLLRAGKIKVESTWWSDFVFDKNYQLMGLEELKKYIELNKHLPNIPSECEVIENGIDVANMQALQQQKIEELTLYTIQQNEQLIKQAKEIEDLKKQMQLLLGKN